MRAAAARVGGEALVRRLVGNYPLLELAASLDAIAAEVRVAVDALSGRAPRPLSEAGRELAGRPDAELRALIATWSDDPSLVDPRFALWVRIAGAPVLERAAAGAEPPPKEEWSGSACPVCGGPPQLSVIVEESGEFMQGSPRYLACERCASWWPFARATCPSCGENDSRRLGPYVADLWPWVRIDACDTCRAYIKTFDLRKPEASDVVPAVDDVATLTLDVWARENGLHRLVLSLAGV